MQRFVSPPLDVPVLDEGEQVDRVDVVFYGVDHSGPSYQGRVFVDNPDADAETPTDDAHGYVGSFTVFGHDGCYGDEGHCLPDSRETDDFDHRAPHPLAPWTKTVIAGAPLLERVQAASTTSVTITMVPIVVRARNAEEPADAGADPAPVDSVRLLTYED
jgi:hypothetical protein